MGARVAVVGPWRWLWYGEELSDDAHTLLEAAGASYAVDGGLVCQAPNGPFGADLQAIRSNQPDLYLDAVVEPANRTLNAGTVPLILAASAASAKVIADVYTDARSGYALRVILALQWWLVPTLAVRGGGETAGFQAHDHKEAGLSGR